MKRTHSFFALAALLVTTTACEEDVVAPEVDEPSFAMAESGRSAAYMFEFGTPPRPVYGISHLRIDDEGVSFRLRTSELGPRQAYTIWLVIFNDPSACSDECGEDDLFNPDAVVDIVYGAGRMSRRSGNASFRGRRNVGDNSGSLFAALGVPAPGLIDPHKAEIHLIVRDHGPRIPGQRREQLTTFEGGCTADSSFGLGDGPYECADVQFAVHLAQN